MFDYTQLHSGILSENEMNKAISYIKARECSSGGYCFYRQNEPNSSDTYFAIASGKILNEAFPVDNSTIAFLENKQNPDGSYFGIIEAFYTVLALSEIQRKPKVDTSSYILKKVDSFKIQDLPPEISIFRKIYFLITITRALKTSIPSGMRRNIIDFIFSFKNEDNGFGNLNNSTLLETMQALRVLTWLKCPLGRIIDTISFISSCNILPWSFTNKPNTSHAFVEHIHAGYIISDILRITPTFQKESMKFIKGCQTTLGGYSRSPFTGIATLEYTFFALDSLRLMQKFFFS